MERHSRDRDSTSESRDGREQMPPPNPRRTSTEPADDKGMYNMILRQDYSAGGGFSLAQDIPYSTNNAIFLNFRFQTSQTRSPG